MIESSAETFRRLASTRALDLPLPAAGRSDERLERLADIARRHPVGVARLAEAHVDAVAILAEVGRRPAVGATYGVWASEQPNQFVSVDRGGRTISGEKPFGTGVGIVDRVLVTAIDGEAHVLLDVDARPSSTLTGLTTGWATSALSDTATAPIVFDRHPIDESAQIGEPGWYLSRPGFWHGACGPAACWAGAGMAIVDAATRLVDDNPHRRAQHGALVAHRWSLEALLRVAGLEMDEAPSDRAAAEHRARALRQIVERACTDILDRFGRAFGPRPFTSDVSIAQRAHDLHLFLRQHHGERELPALSTLVS